MAEREMETLFTYQSSLFCVSPATAEDTTNT